MNVEFSIQVTRVCHFMTLTDLPFQDNFILLSLSDTLEEDEVGEGWKKDSRDQPMSPPRSFLPPTPLEISLRQYEYVCSMYEAS